MKYVKIAIILLFTLILSKQIKAQTNRSIDAEIDSLINNFQYVQAIELCDSLIKNNSDQLVNGKVMIKKLTVINKSKTSLYYNLDSLYLSKYKYEHIDSINLIEQIILYYWNRIEIEKTPKYFKEINFPKTNTDRILIHYLYAYSLDEKIISEEKTRDVINNLHGNNISQSKYEKGLQYILDNKYISDSLKNILLSEYMLNKYFELSPLIQNGYLSQEYWDDLESCYSVCTYNKNDFFINYIKWSYENTKRPESPKAIELSKICLEYEPNNLKTIEYDEFVILREYYQSRKSISELYSQNIIDLTNYFNYSETIHYLGHTLKDIPISTFDSLLRIGLSWIELSKNHYIQNQLSLNICELIRIYSPLTNENDTNYNLKLIDQIHKLITGQDKNEYFSLNQLIDYYTSIGAIYERIVKLSPERAFQHNFNAADSAIYYIYPSIDQDFDGYIDEIKFEDFHKYSSLISMYISNIDHAQELDSEYVDFCAQMSAFYAEIIYRYGKRFLGNSMLDILTNELDANSIQREIGRYLESTSWSERTSEILKSKNFHYWYSSWFYSNFNMYSSAWNLILNNTSSFYKIGTLAQSQIIQNTKNEILKEIEGQIDNFQNPLYTNHQLYDIIKSDFGYKQFHGKHTYNDISKLQKQLKKDECGIIIVPNVYFENISFTIILVERNNSQITEIKSLPYNLSDFNDILSKNSIYFNDFNEYSSLSLANIIKLITSQYKLTHIFPILESEKINYSILNNSSNNLSVHYDMKISRNEKIPNNTDFLLFGNINYGNAPEVEISSEEGLFRSLRSFQNGFFWSNLPGTKSEITNISRNLEKQHTHFFGGDTVNIDLINKLSTIDSRHNIMHFATHGFSLNTNNHPFLESGVVLSLANTGSQGTLMTSFDFLKLDLRNCNLVVLSACNTGISNELSNNQTIGLTRALKIAGVKNCILTLWPISDAETSVFFELFYSHLDKTHDIQKSFSSAQNKMAELYSPFYWGAFVLVDLGN